MLNILFSIINKFIADFENLTFNLLANWLDLLIEKRNDKSVIYIYIYIYNLDNVHHRNYHLID